MAITLDVITQVTQDSLRSSSDLIEKHLAKTGQNAGAGFSKSFAETLQRAPELQKSMDKLADLTGKVRVEQEKLEALNQKGNATDAQKVAQTEKLHKAQRDLAREVREVAKAYEEQAHHASSASNAIDVMNQGASVSLRVLSNLTAGTRLGGLTAEIAKMASGFTEAGVAAEGLGASLLASGLIGGGAVILGVTALTAGVVALGRELYNLGTEWDDVFDSIRVKTGATGDVLAGIQQSVRDVAGQIPESLGAIGDIAAEVSQSMKLVGQDAEQMIISLGTLKHAGIDVNVHDLAQSFRALHIESKDYQATLEQLLNLQQSTGITVDQATKTIDDNAGALKAFGFTVGETITLMRTFEEAGIDPDKGIGSLSKAFKSLTDAGLEPTKANLQKVFDEVRGFIASGDIVKANDELNTLFGPKGGGLSWAELVKDGTLNLNELANAAEAPRSNIQGMANDTYDLSESFTMLGNDIKAGLEPISAEVFNAINSALQSFGQWFKDNKPEIIGFFTGLSTTAISVMQGISAAVSLALESVSVGMKMLAVWLTKVGEIGKNLPFVGDQFKKLEVAGKAMTGAAAEWDAAARGANAFADGPLERLQQKLQMVGDRANSAAQVSRELGDNVKVSDDGKSVVLKDASRESVDQLYRTLDQTQYKLENLPDGNVKIVAQTEEAGVKLQAFIDESSNKPIKLPLEIDERGAKGVLGDLKRDIESGDPARMPISPTFIDGGLMPGRPGGMHRFAAAAGESARDFAHNSMMPFWQSQGFQVGDHAADQYGEHQHGALDVMVGNLVEGNKVLQEALSDPNVYGAIFNNKTYGYGHGATPQDYTAGHTGDPSQDHTNHVHIWYKPGGPNNITGGTGGGMMHFGPGGGMGGGGFSLDDGAAINPLIPQGPTYAPGFAPGPVGSTPGVNEYGEPGYYRPDSKSISSAERAAGHAHEAVDKAEQKIKDLNQDIADLEKQRTVMNSAKTDKDIAAKNAQIKTLQDEIKDLKETAGEADQRVEDAKKGHFTPAHEASKAKGAGKNVWDSEMGAPLAADMGLSEGLPGLAKFATTMLANMAFAPLFGAMKAAGMALAPEGLKGGHGLMGLWGMNNLNTTGNVLGTPAGSSSLFGGAGMGPTNEYAGTAGTTSMYPGGGFGGGGGGGGGGAGGPLGDLLHPPTPPSIPGEGLQHGATAGAAPGPGNALGKGPGAAPTVGGASLGKAGGPLSDARGKTAQTSRQPDAGPGGPGFGVGGGLIGFAESMPATAISGALGAAGGAGDTAGGFGGASAAAGAGSAAIAAALDIGWQELNRAIGQVGQTASIAVGGALETFLPHDSDIADPNKSWFGRIAAGMAGASPALPNAAGGGGDQGEPKPPDDPNNPAGDAAPPQTPEEAAKLQQQQQGGDQGNGGPMVNVENLNNYTADGGQTVANQMARMQMSSYASGMNR